MGRFTGKTCRLVCMLSLTSSFFLVEIIVGYVTNSLALVGDSYHMLSDLVALFVGLASIRISKWKSQKNTFGWARAEVVGALINAVFLMALCFTIFVEALKRFFHDEHIHDPDLMLIVGGIGLAVNILGLFLFHNHSHGHSHGGHGHSHHKIGHKHGHGHGHSHGHKEVSEPLKQAEDVSSRNGDVPMRNSEEEEDDDDGLDIQSLKLSSSAQLNMRGVFLHVLGDALGSVIVIISALIIKFVEEEWRYKVDPAMSMVLVIIILCTSIPLLKQSAMILLQTAPTHIQVHELQEKLQSKVPSVLAVHEFHVWQLAGNCIIASAHIRCQNVRDYMSIAEDVKTFFHNEGIHSTTIQPEFVESADSKPGRDCMLECGPDKSCFPDTCCGKKKPSLEDGDGSPETVLRQRNTATSDRAHSHNGHDPLPSVSGNCPDNIETYL